MNALINGKVSPARENNMSFLSTRVTQDVPPDLSCIGLAISVFHEEIFT